MSSLFRPYTGRNNGKQKADCRALKFGSVLLLEFWRCYVLSPKFIQLCHVSKILKYLVFFTSLKVGNLIPLSYFCPIIEIRLLLKVLAGFLTMDCNKTSIGNLRLVQVPNDLWRFKSWTLITTSISGLRTSLRVK
jgi:hypothetical protein